jgi:hypothetical protein
MQGTNFNIEGNTTSKAKQNIARPLCLVANTYVQRHMHVCLHAMHPLVPTSICACVCVLCMHVCIFTYIHAFMHVHAQILMFAPV